MDNDEESNDSNNEKKTDDEITEHNNDIVENSQFLSSVPIIDELPIFETSKNYQC